MDSQRMYRARLSKDGTIITHKVGVKSLSISEFYHWLITISWFKFYGVLTLIYVSITTIFTLAYLLSDIHNIIGIDPDNVIKSFWQLFFYSAQTLSMVGGVGIQPDSTINHAILTTESMVALSLLTLITGLLFARFSKQAATLLYSEKALIAPHKGGTAFMMRLSNARKRQSTLVDLEAKVMFAWYENHESNRRNIEPLKLEMKKAPLLPVSWTIVHEINEKSPFAKYDLNQIDYEVLVRITAKDSLTGQEIFSGRAYPKDQIVWNARFSPCTEVNEHGVTIVHLDRIGAHEMVNG